jgi:hypothetical protein
MDTVGALTCVPNDSDAIRLVVADFDDRATHKVAGRGGQNFSFFATAVTDNIPPLSHALSEAICLLARLGSGAYLGNHPLAKAG